VQFAYSGREIAVSKPGFVFFIDYRAQKTNPGLLFSRN